MSSLSATLTGQVWLENFDADDKPVAKRLLDSLLLVSASEFNSKVTKQLIGMAARAREAKEVFALYAEREMAETHEEVPPFFPGTERGRATGPGIQPIEVSKKHDVGSEGIVASLISKFRSANPDIVLSHPGPDALRSKRVRKIVIVTDFIGSGFRIYSMLDAFAKVATIQSWRSYGLIAFEVICYSATEDGAKFVEGHGLRPRLTIYAACPVVDETFKGLELKAIRQLCGKYPKHSKWPMGFKATGSLIAFSHGIPNNAPQIFHSSLNGWRPLFQGRSTLMTDLDQAADTWDHIVQQSTELLGVRDAREILRGAAGELWTHTMLILHAVRSGLRSSEALSARTRLPLARITEILALATTAGWLSPTCRLTTLGRHELRWQARSKRTRVLAPQDGDLYFPTQLRAP
ncbi:phosphoribosyltransferase-like protein [Bradyrhizobium sp. USDA 4520]